MGSNADTTGAGRAPAGGVRPYGSPGPAVSGGSATGTRAPAGGVLPYAIRPGETSTDQYARQSESASEAPRGQGPQAEPPKSRAAIYQKTGEGIAQWGAEQVKGAANIEAPQMPGIAQWQVEQMDQDLIRETLAGFMGRLGGSDAGRRR